MNDYAVQEGVRISTIILNAISMAVLAGLIAFLIYNISKIKEEVLMGTDKENFLEKTIVRIYEENGKKMIKFLAYGYIADGVMTDPYRFVEYCWFEEPLKDVLDFGISDYESECGCEYKQLIEDLETEDAVRERYVNYGNGKMPEILETDEININTPCGVYMITA